MPVPVLREQLVDGLGTVRPRQEIFVKNDVESTKATFVVLKIDRAGLNLIHGLRFFTEEEVPDPVSVLSERNEKIEEKSLVTILREKALITI